MPLQHTPHIQSSQKQEFIPLPSDVYQVEVSDVESRMGTKYKSDEEQEQLLFKCTVIEEGQYKGRGVGVFTTLTWFAGSDKLKASKLFLLFSAVYAHYDPQVDLPKWDIDMITAGAINDLIGKQLRVTVELKGDKNKVTSFLPIKAKAAPVASELLTEGDIEDINDQIPF